MIANENKSNTLCKYSYHSVAVGVLSTLEGSGTASASFSREAFPPPIRPFNDNFLQENGLAKNYESHLLHCRTDKCNANSIVVDKRALNRVPSSAQLPL